MSLAKSHALWGQAECYCPAIVPSPNAAAHQIMAPVSQFILPPGQLAPQDILPPALVILTPGGQAVQAGLSCPPAHIKKILLCDVYYYLQHYNNYMQFLSYNYVNLNDYFKHSVGFLIDKGWGASCPGRFIMPPTQNFSENR